MQAIIHSYNLEAEYLSRCRCSINAWNLFAASEKYIFYDLCSVIVHLYLLHHTRQNYAQLISEENIILMDKNAISFKMSCFSQNISLCLEYTDSWTCHNFSPTSAFLCFIMLFIALAIVVSVTGQSGKYIARSIVLLGHEPVFRKTSKAPQSHATPFKTTIELEWVVTSCAHLMSNNKYLDRYIDFTQKHNELHILNTWVQFVV